MGNRLGYGALLAGVISTGCGAANNEQPKAAQQDTQQKRECIIVETDKQKPDDLCDREAIRGSIAEVQLGTAKVICSQLGSMPEQIIVDVSCDRPHWQLSDENSQYGCMNYLGCEKGHLVIRPDQSSGDDWVIRQ